MNRFDDVLTRLATQVEPNLPVGWAYALVLVQNYALPGPREGGVCSNIVAAEVPKLLHNVAIQATGAEPMRVRTLAELREESKHEKPDLPTEWWVRRIAEEGDLEVEAGLLGSGPDAQEACDVQVPQMPEGNGSHRDTDSDHDVREGGDGVHEVPQDVLSSAGGGES